MLTRKPIALDRVLLAISVGIWLSLILIRTEVQEDAYITFRVVSNFVHGYGLRWNLYDRVQTYTNPLWMMLHVPFAFVVRDLFIATVFLGTLCSALAVWLLLRLSASSPLTKILFIMLPLCALRAVIFYSNSGLENALNYLLVAFFAYTLAIAPLQKTPCRECTLIVALACVSRLDMIVLFGPPFLIMLLLRKIPFSLLQIIEGSMPLLAWLAFATFYYGSPLPNTYFAKLPVSDHPMHLWWDGIRYLDLYFQNDWAGFCVLMLSVPLGLLALLRYRRSRSRIDATCFSLAAGIVLFCLYVIVIGADYLMGRFWTVPTFASMACLALSLQGSRQELQKLAAILLVCSGGVLAAGWMVFVHTHLLLRLSHGEYPDYGLVWSWPYSPTDERNLLIDRHGIRFTTNTNMELYQGIQAGYFTKAPIIWDALGMSGYFGNPRAIRVDPVGLGDALLARLPVTRVMIGHMRRNIPAGYIYALQTGNTGRMDPYLAVYYRALRLIISGPLFSPERLETLVRFQLGYYDRYREAYISCQNLDLEQ